MCVKLYLEYNREIFHLILHSDHEHYLTRRITTSQGQRAHEPALKAVHMVTVQNYLQYLSVVVHADPFDSNTPRMHHGHVLTERQPRFVGSFSCT